MLGALLGAAAIGGALSLLRKPKLKFAKMPIDPLDPRLSAALPMFMQTAGDWLAGYGSLFKPYSQQALYAAETAATRTPRFVALTPFGMLPLSRLSHAYMTQEVEPFSTELQFLKAAMMPYDWAQSTLYNYENLRRRRQAVPYKTESDFSRFLGGAMAGIGAATKAGWFKQQGGKEE